MKLKVDDEIYPLLHACIRGSPLCRHLAVELGKTTFNTWLFRTTAQTPVEASKVQSTPQILDRLIEIFSADTGAKDIEAAELVRQGNPAIQIHYIRPTMSLPSVSTIPHPVNMSRMMDLCEEAAERVLGAVLTPALIASLTSNIPPHG